ncbi:MAG: T9SS type A sorting domain-containing protein [Saprospiraceae bacterium]|nr:T9SS type A sorting domain-containing protein [Saprospiraceae bacterium]
MISAVFRDASGSKKVLRARPIDNGFVAINQDYFIKNTGIVNINDLSHTNITIHPNPTTGILRFKGLEGKALLKIYNIEGRQVHQIVVTDDTDTDVSALKSGLFSSASLREAISKLENWW